MKNLLLLTALLLSFCNLFAQNNEKTNADNILILTKSNTLLKNELYEQKLLLTKQTKKIDSILATLQSANTEIKKGSANLISTSQSVSVLEKQSAKVDHSLNTRKNFAIIVAILLIVIFFIIVIFARKNIIAINNLIKQNEENLNQKIQQTNGLLEKETSDLKVNIEKQTKEMSDLKKSIEKQLTETNQAIQNQDTEHKKIVAQQLADVNANINKAIVEINKTIETQIASAKGIFNEQIARSEKEINGKITNTNKDLESQKVSVKTLLEEGLSKFEKSLNETLNKSNSSLENKITTVKKENDLVVKEINEKLKKMDQKKGK